MKRTSVLVAAVMMAATGFSQEKGASLETTFVARAEYSSIEDGYHLGNSSFYTLLDGTFTENLSYSAEIHLLSSDPAALYRNTFVSEETNWLDYAYLSYDFGKFQLEIGKNTIATGTFESDEYDFNNWYELVGPYWMGLQTYQWGAKATWTPTESFSLAAHFTTSPFGYNPFKSGLFAYTLRGAYESDLYQGLYSVNFMQYGENSYMKLFNMGHRFNINKFQITLDSSFGLEAGVPMSEKLTATYNPTEKWAVTGTVGYDCVSLEDITYLEKGDPRFTSGIMVHWKPIECLRFHAVGAYDTLLHAPSFNFGVTWQMTI